jgi:uncharacterized protein YxjI
MREKFLAFGNDSWIEDEDGERAYRVDGKALRRRKTLKLEDTMEIEAPDGRRMA